MAVRFFIIQKSPFHALCTRCAPRYAPYVYIYICCFQHGCTSRRAPTAKAPQKNIKAKGNLHTGFVCLKRTRGAPGPVRGIFGCAPGVRRQQKKHVPEIWISIGFLQVRKRRRAKFSLKIRCAPRYAPYIYIYGVSAAFFLGVRRDMRHIYICEKCMFLTMGVRRGVRRIYVYGVSASKSETLCTPRFPNKKGRPYDLLSSLLVDCPMPKLRILGPQAHGRSLEKVLVTSRV